MAKKKSGNGGMSQLDMLLGLICAIYFLDTIPSGTNMGWTSITWILIVGALFFFTGSLTCAELGAAYPDDGGTRNDKTSFLRFRFSFLPSTSAISTGRATPYGFPQTRLCLSTSSRQPLASS